MTNFNTIEIGKFAANIVTEAGTLLKELRKQPLQVADKYGQNNVECHVDKLIEKFLVDKILETYSNHGIVAEENVYEQEGPNYETNWIIDPIDGTTNFVHNFPFYGISVGIIHKGVGMIGVVYNPSTDELFYAEKGNGAYVNGVPLSLHYPMTLDKALVTTTMYWDNVILRENLHPSLIEIHKKTRGLRMVGGASISLCEIAKGTLNAYVVPMLSTWDYAGGAIILNEAGGILTRLDGHPISYDDDGSLLAAHPSIHQEILKIMSEYDEFRD